MSLYEKNGIIYLIEMDDNEELEHYYERCNFIANQQIQDDNEYNKAITYSRIYINYKYYECLYNDNVMAQLKKMMINLSTGI
jgi:hypothetical protein